jgi:membrane-associated phospholipid phosphatase
MCLALDRSPTMNPDSGFGRFYTDILQIFYVTYYVWGYLPIIMLGYMYIVAWRRKDGNEVNRRLAQLKLYLTGWLAAFLLVFICNTILPARSPRLYFKHIFHHPKLEGFGLARLLIGAATDDTSFGSFPSGHFAESLVSGIYLLRIHKPTGILVIVSSGMIGLATQALRYHYFSDLLGAAIIVVVTLAFGFCLSGGMFRRETARIMASYAAQVGIPFWSDSNSTELSLRGSDDGSSVDDYETRSAASSEVDLEAAQSEMPANHFVHTLI